MGSLVGLGSAEEELVLVGLVEEEGAEGGLDATRATYLRIS